MQASCHCGKVSLTMTHTVAQVTSCNCSMCHRLGALWGYYKSAEVTIAAGENDLDSYCHGDEYIRFFRCKSCGCLTHYQATEKAEVDKVAVNYRMVDKNLLTSLDTRYFDGADTWETLRIEPAQTAKPSN